MTRTDPDPDEPAPPGRWRRWRVPIVLLALAAGWVGFMGWRAASAPVLQLPNGVKLRFHSLSVGVPKTPPNGSGHHAHPTLNPPLGWWTRTRGALINALPAGLKSRLLTSWIPSLMLYTGDPFEMFVSRYAIPKYRFAFEVTGGDFKATDWQISITSQPGDRVAPTTLQSSSGPGMLTVGTGPGGATPTAPPYLWFTVYCPELPEDATSFRLTLRKKTANRAPTDPATPMALSFPNPLPQAAKP